MIEFQVGHDAIGVPQMLQMFCRSSLLPITCWYHTTNLSAILLNLKSMPRPSVFLMKYPSLSTSPATTLHTWCRYNARLLPTFGLPLQNPNGSIYPKEPWEPSTGTLFQNKELGPHHILWSRQTGSLHATIVTLSSSLCKLLHWYEMTAFFRNSHKTGQYSQGMIIGSKSLCLVTKMCGSTAPEAVISLTWSAATKHMKSHNMGCMMPKTYHQILLEIMVCTWIQSTMIITGYSSPQYPNKLHSWYFNILQQYIKQKWALKLVMGIRSTMWESGQSADWHSFQPGNRIKYKKIN